MQYVVERTKSYRLVVRSSILVVLIMSYESKIKKLKIALAGAVRGIFFQTAFSPIEFDVAYRLVILVFEFNFRFRHNCGTALRAKIA